LLLLLLLLLHVSCMLTWNTAKVAGCKHHALFTISSQHICTSLLLLLQVLEWKDYVRGKDLAKWLKERQGLLDQHTRPQSTSACFIPSNFLLSLCTCFHFI
jgi:hypothetical protein